MKKVYHVLLVYCLLTLHVTMLLYSGQLSMVRVMCIIIISDEIALTQPSTDVYIESEPTSSLDHHHASSNTTSSATTSSNSKSNTTTYHYYYESTLMPSRNKPTPTTQSAPTQQPSVPPPSNKVPIPPMPMSHTHVINAKNSNVHNRQMNHSSKRRRREMQAITMIIETREFPYNDDYLWKNNGNTIHKGSGNKSIYYKCANNPKVHCICQYLSINLTFPFYH